MLVALGLSKIDKSQNPAIHSGSTSATFNFVGRGELIGPCRSPKAGAASPLNRRRAQFANLPLKDWIESCQQLPRKTLVNFDQWSLPESNAWPFRPIPFRSSLLAICCNSHRQHHLFI